MTPDQELMLRVRNACGSYINAATEATPYPAAFLAALTANETGGILGKTRFEPTIFGKFGQIIVGHEAGHEATYGSIGALDLLKWCDPPQPPGQPPRKFTDVLIALVNLATSWGPTQIMGYEALAGGFALSRIVNVETHYAVVVEQLEIFRARWHIVPGPGEPMADLFRCWNTGRPDGQTADPEYVPNGILRMGIYAGLPAAA